MANREQLRATYKRDPVAFEVAARRLAKRAGVVLPDPDPDDGPDPLDLPELPDLPEHGEEHVAHLYGGKPRK